MKTVIKYIFMLLFINVMFFVFNSKVYARILTIDEVKESIDNLLTEYQTDITTSIDQINKTLTFIYESEEVITFNYGNDYIEYDNRTVEITEDEATNDFSRLILTSVIIQTVFELSGYDSSILNDIVSEDSVTNYETYGLQLESEKYEFSDPNISGDFLRYFKITLDTDKIDNFMNSFGIGTIDHVINSGDSGDDTDLPSNNNNNNNSISKETVNSGNPNTGAIFPYMLITILILCSLYASIVLYKIIKKK